MSTVHPANVQTGPASGGGDEFGPGANDGRIPVIPVPPTQPIPGLIGPGYTPPPTTGGGGGGGGSYGGGGGSYGGGGGGTSGNGGVSIVVQTMIVRTEEDIRIIAEQIFAMWLRQQGQRVAIGQGVYVP